MTIPTDPDARRNWMAERWKAYGERFAVFVPKEEPIPDIWEPPIPPPDAKGRLHPHAVKTWHWFGKTKGFLRQRYSGYGVLKGPGLHFDCLAPQFQPPVPLEPEERRRWGAPKETDPPEWYAWAIEMRIYKGMVVFSCHSNSCKRFWCKFWPAHPRLKYTDIYGLLHIFHGYESMGTALVQVRKGLGIPLASFSATGSKEPVQRFAVPKEKIYELIERYTKIKPQHVPQLVRDAYDLIQSCDWVNWHGRMFSDEFAYFSRKIVYAGIIPRIGSPAIKLYLWLLIKQEEEARRGNYSLRFKNADVAGALRVSPKTAGIYRASLEGLGILKIDEGVWRIKYAF